MSDFEFTNSKNKNEIAYGSAGDCYSAIRCPQGRFSIDLSNTGFRVSRMTKWVTKGAKATYQDIHMSNVSCSPRHMIAPHDRAT